MKFSNHPVPHMRMKLYAVFGQKFVLLIRITNTCIQVQNSLGPADRFDRLIELSSNPHLPFVFFQIDAHLRCPAICGPSHKRPCISISQNLPILLRHQIGVFA